MDDFVTTIYSKLDAFTLGELIEGTITRITETGVTVKIYNGVSGWIPNNEVSNTPIKNLQGYFYRGQPIRARIIGINRRKSWLTLSIKQMSIHDRLVIQNLKKEKESTAREDISIITNNYDKWMQTHQRKAKFNMITLNTTGLLDAPVSKKYKEKIERIIIGMEKGTLPGNDFLGWIKYPINLAESEIKDLIDTGKRLRDDYEVMVVCGIGGSYLGTRAVVDALEGIGPKIKKEIEIIYFGNTFSPTYTSEVLSYLKHKNFCVNVISKSGTTTETSLAFRLLKNELESRYKKSEVQKRIVATTDSVNGLLKKLAKEEGYKTFVMPDDVGGRYSVFTPVGLLPIAAAGFDIRKLIQGARNGYRNYMIPELDKNLAANYAIIRNHMYTKLNKTVELYTVYEPHFSMLNEWLKQLFGESEGKDGKGIFPCSVCYSTDLHSLGQFVQDGNHILFETNIQVENPLFDLTIPPDSKDLDELNYLAGKDMNFVNKQAFAGTKKAHVDEGKVNNIDIVVQKMDEETIGELFYFFMVSCAISSYLLDVNPFNQPGVEVYKKNMFDLLGKPKK